jgi:shikimate kinase
VHWVLVGLMGSGKTTVGRALAARTGRALIDNDQQLLATTGQTARQLADSLGSEALHDLERAALVTALDHPVPAIITAAASVVEDAAVRALLGRRALVAWLDVDPAVSAQRVGAQHHRPLGADAARVLQEQAEDRAALFAEVADVVVMADRDVDELADEILGALTPLG